MFRTAVVSIDQAAPVGPQIYDTLRERIIRNALEPSARVSEAEIAAAFGVSRQPVREAFIKLAEEGLVEIRPQRGTYITRISTAAVMDARFVREAVEADIVRLLAQSRDDALIAMLQSQLAAQRACPEQDADRFIQLDEQFHRTLAEACGKGQIWRVVEGLKAQMDRVRYLNLLSRLPKQALLTQHEAIMRAIADRDEAAAEAAMRNHLRQILDELPQIAAAHPEYFEAS
ncbi:MAG: GntR family transcriptional regulator [Pikeienuella sp.]